MKAAFRVDASAATGTAAIKRCRLLATQFLRRGAHVAFVVGACGEAWTSLLASEGFEVLRLPGGDRDEKADAALTLTAVGDLDVIVVDHPTFREPWERQLRAAAKQVIAIGGASDGTHAADILIDPTFTLAAQHDGVVQAGRRLFRGPRYAILEDAFVKAGSPAPVAETVGTVLLHLGDEDPADLTRAAFAALSGAEFAALNISIAIGDAYAFRAELAAEVARRPNTALHVGVPSLAPLLKAADVMVGGVDAGTWESLALGVPLVLITAAPDHLSANWDFEAAGIAARVASAPKFDAAALQDSIRQLIGDRARRAALSLNGRLLVDGLGARRIVELLWPTDTDAVRLRAATRAHMEYLFQLMNVPDVRAQSFAQKPIAWDEHMAWFARKQGDIDAEVWILEASGLPIGQIRVDRRDGDALLSYALDPVVRGRGWGLRLVQLGLAAIRPHSVGRIIAEVKPTNLASRAILDRLGFGPRVSQTPDKLVYARN